MADSNETSTEDTSTDDGTKDTKSDDSLGDGGKRALEAERAGRKVAEKAAKEHEAELAKARAELDTLREGQLSDHEKALETARKESADAATASADEKYRTRLDAADVKAAAVKFADPADALRYLDLTDLARDADGGLEAKALGDALAAVLAAKPYLAKTGTGPGSADGGARGGSDDAPDLGALSMEEFRKARRAAGSS